MMHPGYCLTRQYDNGAIHNHELVYATQAGLSGERRKKKKILKLGRKQQVG